LLLKGSSRGDSRSQAHEGAVAKVSRLAGEAQREPAGEILNRKAKDLT
jgi:hypothetical protein